MVPWRTLRFASSSFKRLLVCLGTQRWVRWPNGSYPMRVELCRLERGGTPEKLRNLALRRGMTG